MSSNHLSRILSDQLYIGKIIKKLSNDVFDGVHKPIISKKLWNEVQDKLKTNNHRKTSNINFNRYLLHYKIMSADGTVFKNMKTSKTKNKFSYRYYTMPNFYLPAGNVDNITREVMENFLNSDVNILPQSLKLTFKHISYCDKLINNLITKIIYHDDKLTYFINISNTDYLKPYIN